MSEIKWMKIRAKKLLGVKGNWVKIVIAGILLVFVCFMPLVVAMSLTNVIVGAPEPGTDLYLLGDLLFYGVWAVLAFCVTVPGVTLFYRYVWSLYEQTKEGFSVNDRRKVGWFRSYPAALLIVLRPIGVAAIFVLAYVLASVTDFWLYLPFMVLAIGLATLFMWATGGAFFVPYFVCRGMSAGKALRASRRTMKKKYKLYGAYMMSFIGLVLLSLLTVGVLLLFYTMPVMMFTYFALADRVTGEETQEESNQ